VVAVSVARSRNGRMARTIARRVRHIVGGRIRQLGLNIVAVHETVLLSIAAV
jgi:hypothetical protein